MKLWAAVVLLFYCSSQVVANGAREPVTVLGAKVPMRDGILLAADYYIPEGPGPFPTIVEFTPYGRGNPYFTFLLEVEHWRSNGYAFLICDARGQGDSEGVFMNFINDATDTHDLIEWIATQPWSNGRIGMRGSSYSGIVQWYAAKEVTPHLSCITPAASGSIYPLDEAPYFSGVFFLKWSLTWPLNLPSADVNVSAAVFDWDNLLHHKPLSTIDEEIYGKPLALFRDYLQHDTIDEYWNRLHVKPEDYAKILIPSITFTGWFDGELPGAIKTFQDASQYSPSPSKRYLVIGPWQHGNAPDGGYNFITGEPILSVGDLPLPINSVLPALNITTDYFNWCLKDGPELELPPVSVYLTGSNQWVHLEAYPPAATQQLLYLSSSGRANGIAGDGKLKWDLNIEEETDEIVYNPVNPGKDYRRDENGTYHTVIDTLPVDVSSLIDRNDTLFYVTDSLAESLTVLGNIQLKLYFSSDVYDLDFFPILEDVYPDGKAVKLGPRSSGFFKARYRNGYDQQVPLEPNVPVEVTINLYDIGHTFLQGHRLRLSIGASLYPTAFPNSGTGKPVSSDTDTPLVAHHRIYHNLSQPSHLIIPVYASV